MECEALCFFLVLLAVILAHWVWRKFSRGSTKQVPYKIVRGEKVTGEAKKKRVCAVVGGTGFVGSHVVDELVKRNEYHVYVLGRKFRPKRTNPDADCLIQVDMQDQGGLEKAFEGVDSVINTAVLFPNASVSADELFRVNEVGFENIIKAAKKAGVKHLVHISAGRISNPSKHPVMKAYRDSFYQAEEKFLKANGEEGLKTCAIGPSNIVGLRNPLFELLISGKRSSIVMNDAMPNAFIPADYVAKVLVNAERKLTTEQSGEIAGKFFRLPGESMSWKTLFTLPTWPKKISNTPMWFMSFLAHINVFCVMVFGWAPLGPDMCPALLEMFEFVGEKSDEDHPQVAEVYKVLEVGPPAPPMEEYIKELVKRYNAREESRKEK